VAQHWSRVSSSGAGEPPRKGRLLFISVGAEALRRPESNPY